jgi:hypothetical protein
VEAGAAFIADAQALELVEPGKGTLDHPPGLPQAGAMGDTSPGDEWLDAALPQQAAVLVEVVAPIGEYPLGPVPRAAPQSAMRGIASSSGMTCVTS